MVSIPIDTSLIRADIVISQNMSVDNPQGSASTDCSCPCFSLTDVAAFGYSDDNLVKEVNSIRHAWLTSQGRFQQLLEATSSAETSFLDRDNPSGNLLETMLRRAVRAEFAESAYRIHKIFCWVQIYDALENGLQDFVNR